MKRLLLVIITILVFASTVVVGAEYFSTKNGEFVKIRGILDLSWEEVSEEEEKCGKLYDLLFYSENKKDFAGYPITLYAVDMDYYNVSDEYVYGDKNHHKEMEKIMKNLFPNEKEDIWRNKKGNKKIPVEITINLKNIKTFTECDYTSIYTKVDKIEKINTNIKRKDFSEGDNSIHYEVYSKDGYANMRKKPNSSSEIVKKVYNDKDDLHYILSIGDWHYFYQNGYNDTKNYGGFIHKSQVEKRYAKFIINSKEGYTNVREKPNSSSKVLKVLKNREKIEKIRNEGEWVAIELGHDKKKNEYIYGYIHRSQLKLID